MKHSVSAVLRNIQQLLRWVQTRCLKCEFAVFLKMRGKKKPCSSITPFRIKTTSFNKPTNNPRPNKNPRSTVHGGVLVLYHPPNVQMSSWCRWISSICCRSQPSMLQSLMVCCCCCCCSGGFFYVRLDDNKKNMKYWQQHSFRTAGSRK